MRRIKQLFRLIHINFILARHGLDKIILSLRLFAPLRFMIYLNPFNWFRAEISRGQSIRLALEELGPIFVKFGQTLSTRRDLIPPDIAEELAKLQDRVPAFDGKYSTKLIEKYFQKPVSDIFAEFDSVALASASIAQVHAAKLNDGSDVIVKVLRPNIRHKIDRDISLLYFIAGLAKAYWPEAKRLHPVEVVREFEKTILDELDLNREAANASELKRNFKNSDLLYVPKIYWPYTSEKIMVQERVYGIPVTDIEQLKANNINIKKLAERGVEIFFTQVFRDNFFHADMHPGNLFISKENPDNPKYIAVDFGIVGSLNDGDLRYLAENFHAFFKRDYTAVAKLHVESGWTPPDTRIEDFASAIRTVCEPIFERPIKDISCAQMLLYLFQTGRRFNMEVQPQLVLLQKTLFAIEGLGRQLYPELDLWKTAKPYIDKWIREQASPQAVWNNLKSHAPRLSQQLPALPGLIFDTLSYFSEKRLEKRHGITDRQLTLAKTQYKKRGFLRGIAASLIAAGAAFIAHAYLPFFAYNATTIGFAAVALGCVMASLTLIKKI